MQALKKLATPVASTFYIPPCGGSPPSESVLRTDLHSLIENKEEQFLVQLPHHRTRDIDVGLNINMSQSSLALAILQIIAKKSKLKRCNEKGLTGKYKLLNSGLASIKCYPSGQSLVAIAKTDMQEFGGFTGCSQTIPLGCRQ